MLTQHYIIYDAIYIKRRKKNEKNPKNTHFTKTILITRKIHLLDIIKQENYTPHENYYLFIISPTLLTFNALCVIKGKTPKKKFDLFCKLIHLHFKKVYIFSTT